MTLSFPDLKVLATIEAAPLRAPRPTFSCSLPPTARASFVFHDCDYDHERTKPVYMGWKPRGHSPLMNMIPLQKMGMINNKCFVFLIYPPYLVAHFASSSHVFSKAFSASSS